VVTFSLLSPELTPVSFRSSTISLSRPAIAAWPSSPPAASPAYRPQHSHRISPPTPPHRTCPQTLNGVAAGENILIHCSFFFADSSDSSASHRKRKTFSPRRNIPNIAVVVVLLKVHYPNDAIEKDDTIDVTRSAAIHSWSHPRQGRRRRSRGLPGAFPRPRASFRGTLDAGGVLEALLEAGQAYLRHMRGEEVRGAEEGAENRSVLFLHPRALGLRRRTPRQRSARTSATLSTSASVSRGAEGYDWKGSYMPSSPSLPV
jgi:hypothetical protein